MIAGEQKLLPGFLEGSLTGGAFFILCLLSAYLSVLQYVGEGRRREIAWCS